MSNEYATWPALTDFQPSIKRELLRRKNKTFGDGNKPRATWVRAISNAVDAVVVRSPAAKSGETTSIGDIRNDLNVMVGGLLRPSGATRGGFEPVYQRVATGREIIDRPMPGIESISLQTKGDYGSLRKITINWLCPSVEDLDILMPYWLSPGISVVVEWGWSNIGQPPIPLDILNVADMVDLYKNPALIMKKIILRGGDPKADYAGNQDFFIGIITNFSWNMNEDGTFTCTTELTTFGETMLALNLNKDVKTKGVKVNEKTIYSIREYVEKAFSNENLDSQMKALPEGHEKDIIKTPTITEEPKQTKRFIEGDYNLPDSSETNGDIYVTWGFIERNVITKHGCPAVDADWFVFEMDSSNTRVSNDGFLYSRDSDILINNNGNNTMIEFSTPPKNYNAEIFGKVDEKSTTVGFLNNVYVRRSVLVDAFKNSETLEEAVKKLINKIRYAAFDLWDLKLHTDPTKEQKAEVIDQKFVSKKSLDDVKQLLIAEKNTEGALFNFGGYSGTSILRSVSFTSKLTDQVALTHFFGRNKDTITSNNVVYSADSDTGIKAIYGAAVDRVLRKLQFKEDTIQLKEAPPIEEEDKKRLITILSDEKIAWTKSAPTSDLFFYYKNENDRKSVGQYLRRVTDDNKLKNVPIYFLEISVVIDGISGILPGHVFTMDNLPRVYRENGVFQILEISHEISSDDWETTLRAYFRPVNIFAGSKKTYAEKTANVTFTGKEENDPVVDENFDVTNTQWRSSDEPA